MPKASNMSDSAKKDMARYYKAAKEQYGKGEKASRTAWMIFKKKHKKNASGDWVRAESYNISEDILDISKSMELTESLLANEIIEDFIDFSEE